MQDEFVIQPANEADIWAAQFKYTNMQKVASIFGFGTGVFVKAVLNRLLKMNMR